MVEARLGEGAVLLLAWDRLTGPGWSGFAQTVGLTNDLRSLLLALGGASRPAVFIDGPDRITDVGAQKVINDLLRTLASVSLSADGSRNWTVVLSVREDSLAELHSWLDWKALDTPNILSVNELTSEEIRQIADQSPRLSVLLANTDLRPITSNLFMLSVLEDQRMSGQPDRPSVVTEIGASTTWWERVIGSGSLGMARKQALLELGRRSVRARGQRFTEQGLGPDALRTLESDRILLRDPGRDTYRFGHDILEDWVLSRVLDQNRESLTSYLKGIGQPFGLFRPLQLLGASVLEQHPGVEQWLQLVEQIEEDKELALRWRRALLTAPLYSSRALDLLDKAELVVFADEGRRLRELLVAVRTVAVTPDFSLLPAIAMMAETPVDALSFLLMSPLPLWRVWTPFMGWLLSPIDKVPDSLRPEVAALMDIWQDKSPEGSPYREQIGRLALNWLTSVE
jgi:hypothetical protein